MADVKISALPLATTPLAGTEVLPIVQSATTDQVSVANLTAGRAVSALSLTLTGTPLAVGSGGTGLTSLTAGYIPFGGSTTYSSDSNLFWDNTNKRLGVGTSSPIAKFHALSGSGATLAQIAVGYGGSANYYDADSHNFRNAATTGSVNIDSSQRISAAAVTLSSGSTPNTAGIITAYGGSNNYYDANTQIWRNGSSSESMRLTNGSLFIGGTTAPVLGTELLGVYGPLGVRTTTSTAQAIWTATTGATSFISLYTGLPAVSIGAISTNATSLNISGANSLNLQIAGVTKATLDATGNVILTGTGAGLGYGTGTSVGGTVTQLTSKATGVTLSKACGQITLDNAALAADTTVSFTLTNTVIAATDVIIWNHQSGGTIGSYTITSAQAAGSATVYVRNVTAGSLSEAIVLSFAVIRAATN